MVKHWSSSLRIFGACEDTVKWCQEQPSFKEAWETCQRGDWMLWILGKLSGLPDSESRRKLVGTCGECAKLMIHHFKARYPDDDRPQKAIQACEDHAAGKINAKQCRTAAYAAAYAAYAAAAAAAAYAAAYAAYAAAAAAADAADAADAAAAYAAYAAAAAAAADAYAGRGVRAQTLAECANIVRKNYHEEPTI